MLKFREFLGFLRPARGPNAAGLEPEQARLQKERQSILNHAYGFISRGNRAAGVRHIEEYLGSETWDAATGIWFFDAMTGWEHPDAALAFGRDLIGRLLLGGFEGEARKVLLQCKLLDDGFLPRPQDQIPLAEATRP